MAVDIDEAIRSAQREVYTKFSGTDGLANGIAALDIWIQVFSNFDPGQLDENTVRDWFVPTQAERDRLGTLTQAFDPSNTYFFALDAQSTFENVFRMCNAAKFAEIDGRITTTQLNAVVAQYNLAWP